MGPNAAARVAALVAAGVVAVMGVGGAGLFSVRSDASAEPPTCDAPHAASGFVAEVVDATNADRATHGLPKLRWDPRLWCLANEWTGHLVEVGELEHRELSDVLRTSAYDSYRLLGENLLSGPTSLSATGMEAAWMASPDHRDNILDREFTSIAVATTLTDDGRHVYVTVNFGG
jgi:uncharacterized protein YkwD